MVRIADVSDYEAEPESLQSVAGGGITSCHRDGREGAGCPTVANLKTPADSKKRIVAPKGLGLASWDLGGIRRPIPMTYF